MLNDVVVEFGFAAEEVEFDNFVRRMRRVANGSRKPRIERSDGHHSSGGDFVLQVVREFCELVDIAFDASDEPAELREDFVYVGGNFRHGARQDVHVVVAIHFEFAEFGKERRIAGGCAGEHLPRRLQRLFRNRPARTKFVVLVLFLELGDFALQAFFRKAERFDETLQFGDASNHSRTVDDEFADGIHHAVEACKAYAHGFRGVCSLLPVAGIDARRGGRWRCRGRCFLLRHGDQFAAFNFYGSKLRDLREQGIDAVAHFGFVGPLFL